MKGKEESTSTLMLSKLPGKPLKRRRIRLGNTEPELDDTTLELLSALREVPSNETKSKNLKPLPAIGSVEKQKSVDLELESLRPIVKCKPEEELSDDVRLIDDALSHPSNDRLKMTLRPRRRRETNFPLQKKENVLTDTDNDSVKEKQRFVEPLDLLIDYNDNNSVISDFSEDFTENTEYRYRDKYTNDIANFEENSLTSRSIARAGRRSKCMSEPPIQRLSLERRSNRKASDLIEPEFEMQDSNGPMSKFLDDGSSAQILENNSISSECKETTSKKRSRRWRRNDDEESVTTARGENGFSDVASAFSDDFSESYDPTSNFTQCRLKNDNPLPSASGNDDDASSSTNSGIFTSPQRHKKRSRRRQVDVFSKKEENPLFSNDADLLSPNSFHLADVDDFSYQSRTFCPKQQRRRPRKFLPPLSENLTNSK